MPHRKGGKKGGKFYFGDRFCYVNGYCSTTRLRTSSDEFAEGVTVYWQASSQTPFW